MSDIINLSQRRKARTRADKEERAKENRAKFGRTKEQKSRDAKAKKNLETLLDRAKREDT